MSSKEQQGIAEIVSFEVTVGTSVASVFDAAEETLEYLKEQPGFQRRTLSMGEDGSWTDHVLWSDMDAATKAASNFMQAECNQAFIKMINPKTMKMRHEHVRMTTS